MEQEQPDGIFIPSFEYPPKKFLTNSRKFLDALQKKFKVSIKFNVFLQRFEIWGESYIVEQVKKALLNRTKFLVLNDKSKREEKWGKPLDEKRLRKEQKLLRKEEWKSNRLEKLLNPKEEYSEYCETLLIPTSCINDSDFEFHSEFLNNIRLQFDVHVMLEIESFQLRFTGEETKVSVACKTVQYAIAQKTFKDYTPKIVHLIENYSDIETVELKKIVMQRRLPFNKSTICILTPQYNERHKGYDINEHQKQRAENLKSIEVLKSGLRVSLVHNGLLKLSLRFGKICFTKFPNRTSLPFEKFKSCISDLKWKSEISRDILYNSNKFEEVLNLLSKEGLEFHDNPYISYHMKCIRPDDSQEQIFNLNLNFSENGTVLNYNGYYDYTTVSAIYWCFLNENMLLDFQIALERSSVIDTRNSYVKRFIDSINLNGDSELIYADNKGVKLSCFIKKKLWIYEISGYLFELSQNQLYFTEPASLKSIKKNPIQTLNLKPTYVVHELKIEKEKWKKAFALNPNLKLGKKADYDYKRLITPGEYGELIELSYNWIKKVSNIIQKET